MPPPKAPVPRLSGRADGKSRKSLTSPLPGPTDARAGSPPPRGWSAGNDRPFRCDTCVRGNRVDVKDNRVDVKGNMVAVKGDGVDVKQTFGHFCV
eukprot:1186981-Prorocentrum_minimum.AAC.7